MLEAFFGWRLRQQVRSHTGSSSRAAAAAADADDFIQLRGAVAESPPPSALPLLKKKTSLDARLYEFAARQAEEQHRSLVWEAESGAASGTDVCAAAEAAGEVSSQLRTPPVVMTFDTATTFTWDGDSYHVYELRIPPPLRATHLMLRGKSVIGSSPFSVNILISHRASRPSFAERSFRYVFNSKPPHAHSGKFQLSAERLRACCVEVATAEGDAEAEAACHSTRSLTLYVALKCRSKAVAQMTVLAHAGGSRRRGN